MRVAEMNWMQMEAYLRRDDLCVLPVGSVEQHAQLSLCVDAILAERVAVEAAEPLGIPVYPAMPFGLSPYFTAFPGTVSLRVETLLAVIRDVIDCLANVGFRRILIVNGHGGNAPLAALAQESMARRPNCAVKFHPWWMAPRTAAKACEIDPDGSHANWMENFPWTRLAGVPSPEGSKPMIDHDAMRASPPDRVREMLGDGSFGGRWRHGDEEMRALWAVGVEETREVLEGPWPGRD